MKLSLFKNISRVFQAVIVLLVFEILVFISQQVIMGLERIIRVSSEEFRLLQEQLQRHYRPDELCYQIDSAAKQITPQGEIHLVNYEYREKSRIRLVTVRDVNWNILWQGNEDDLPFTYVESFYHAGPYSLELDIWPWTMPVELGRSLKVTVFENGKAAEFWRLVPQKSMFEGYTQQRQQIGYIGPLGFSKEKNRVGSFGHTLGLRAGPEDIYYFVSDYKVYSVNFVSRKTVEVFQSSTAKIIGMGYENVYDVEKYNREPRYRPYLHILTEDGTERLFIEKPDEEVVFHLPQGWDFRRFQMAVTDQRILLWRQDSYQEGRFQPELLIENANNLELFLNSCQRVNSIEVYEVTDSGELKKLSGLEWKVPESPWRAIYEYYSAKTTLPVATAFSPPVYKLKPVKEEDSNGGPFASRMPLWLMLSGMLEEGQPINLLYCLIASCLCIVLALLHAWPRRTGWARLSVWMGFVGVFNLAGLLTYLALNHTAVVKCPVCGRKRGLEATDCVRCGAALAEPELRDADKVLITKSATSGRQE
jgi:hypothetical protein